MRSSTDDNQYLVTEVFTAPPQKLQLMLIEAAVRLVRRAAQQWQARQNGQACQSLLQAQEIMEELITGINRDAWPEVADRVTAVYEFVARLLREANADRDEKKLQDALRILEIERETWRQVCIVAGGREGFPAREGNAESSVPPAPHLRGLGLASELPVGGFSMEV